MAPATSTVVVFACFLAPTDAVHKQYVSKATQRTEFMDLISNYLEQHRVNNPCFTHKLEVATEKVPIV